jgi:hypothetical protein
MPHELLASCREGHLLLSALCGHIGDEVSSADDIRQAIQRAIVHIDLTLEKLKKKGIKTVVSVASNSTTYI